MGGFFSSFFSPITAIASAIGGLLGGDDNDFSLPPLPPAPVTPPPAPNVPTQEDTLAAEAEQRKRVSMMQGKASNVLTSGGWQGLGESEEDQTVSARKRLLG